MIEVAIVAGVRTPIGRLGGVLSEFSSVELGTQTLQAAIGRSQLHTSQIDQVIMGNVLQAGAGQNVARQIAIKSGLPVSSTAMTINQVCGSGLKAIRLGQTAIMVGDANIVAVGGTESMSQAPFLVPNMRFGHHFGDVTMQDSLLRDGLVDAFSQEHMGITAENVAERFHVSREVQDRFALASQRKANQATQNGIFKAEIVPIERHIKGKLVIVDQDEAIRPDSNLEKMSQLKPAFKLNGTVTAGNASGVNDGAAAMILMDKADASQRKIPILGLIKGYAEVGNDPEIMGVAPIAGIQKLLNQTNLTIEDIDLFEINEAFASQSIAIQEALSIPIEKINVSGGAIALGHPIGASGARIVVTLLHHLKRLNKHYGIASLCVGGGMSVSMLLANE